VRPSITPYKPKAQCGAVLQHDLCVPEERDNRGNPYGLSCRGQIPRRGWLSIDKGEIEERFPVGDDDFAER